MNAPGQRDDFSSEVKQRLAARAGYRCSMPICRAPTAGPSTSRASGISNVGVAAHIAAASSGGPRYDPTQSAGERQAYDNGIWLCQTDAKRIDDDDVRYTTELLIGWRVLAEKSAHEEQGQGIDRPHQTPRALVPHRRILAVGADAVRDDVHAFLEDTGAPTVWSANYDIAWMVLYEIALNAVTHGGAVSLLALSDQGLVSLRDDGAPFGLQDLRTGGQGGHRAVKDLDEHAYGSLSLIYRFEDGRNEWSLVDQVLAQGADTPCGLTLHGRPHEGREAVIADMGRLANCTEIHFYPDPRWSYSDWFVFLGDIKDQLDSRRLVVHGFTENALIAQAISEFVPGVAFLP